jgi:hypothetical protein
MFPDDRVLVGVINRKRDLMYAQNDHWYRVPQKQFPHGLQAEYVALFLSKAFKERNGGIYYFALWRGIELVHRKDLLPNEADHARADEVYYKIQLGDLKEKDPPVLNPTRRTVSFIYTTWDRFVHAQQVSDLYSKGDYYVDRIYHALHDEGIASERTWEAQFRNQVAQLRVLCHHGPVVASTQQAAGQLYLDENQPEDEILMSILAEIHKQGGPVTINLPLGGGLWL